MLLNYHSFFMLPYPFLVLVLLLAVNYSAFPLRSADGGHVGVRSSQAHSHLA